MKTPYDILGVSPNASDDEIKKAYRNLSRKFHPDANVNNPNKEQAEECFKEVQQAYQTIMNEKDSQYGNYHSYGGFSSTYQTYSNAAYGNEKDMTYLQAAVNYIKNNDFQSALHVLEEVENKSSKWYFVSAIANQGMGNQANALEHIQIAMRMEPGNYEYQQFYHVIQNGGAWYTGRGAEYGMPTVDGSGFCCKLCFANMLCNFFCC